MKKGISPSQNPVNVSKIISRTSLLPLLFLSFLPQLVFAGLIPVTSTADSGAGSLREAIIVAMPGDSITFQVRGEIVVDSQLIINKNLTLLGPGADQLAITTLDSTRLLWIGKTDTVIIEGLRFYNGNATGYDPPFGGAISNNGHLSIKASIFHDNIATSGGAIENQGFGVESNFLRVESSSFYHNLAIQPISGFIEFGGAIYADARGAGNTRVEVYNSTFAENQAKISGGAIYVVGDQGVTAKLSMENCTVAFNVVEGRCGGVDVSLAQSLSLKNTLIADNTGRADIPDVFGAILSGGNNLIGDTGTVEIINNLSTDIFEVDAGLGPFGLNGGIFPTVSLRCGSPAIDAGDDAIAPIQDLRGQARIGTSDIGSFERNEAIDLQVNNLEDSGWGSLRQAISLSCPGDTIVLNKVVGRIGLKSELRLTQHQVIQGNPQNPVFLNGGDSLRIMYIEPGVSISLFDLNFEWGNPANFGGGAIMNKGTLEVSRSCFRNNKASGAGAIANYGDLGPVSLTASNCSFAENEALFLDGGAIDNRAFTHSASANLTHCSFALNRAENRGGAVHNDMGADMQVANSLWGNNQATEGLDLYGDIQNEGINLVQQDVDIQWSNGSSSLIVSDPLLDPLDYYGGGSYSFRLQAGSPAIDAGDNTLATTFDQRGASRIFNGMVDVGAYEYDPATSIEDQLSQDHLSLFPQPNRGIFTLSWPEAAGKEIVYQLLDLQGKVIRQMQLKLDIDGNYLKHEPSLPPGYYLINLSTKDQHSHVILQISP